MADPDDPAEGKQETTPDKYGVLDYCEANLTKLKAAGEKITSRNGVWLEAPRM